MANNFVPVQLNKGLDLVSPPMTAEPGSLLSCLNYEMQDATGYRRLDGYERYDGYPNGAITTYYRVVITAVDPLDQVLIVPGSLLSREGTDVPEFDIAVIVGGPFPTNYYDVASLVDTSSFIVEEDFLLLEEPTEQFLLLEGSGLLKIIEAGIVLGDTFYVTTPSGVKFEVTIDSTPVNGKELDDVQTYVDNIRAYSAVLRALVQRAPSAIAGLYWFRDRLLAAVDMFGITIQVLAVDPQPLEGALFAYDGITYRLMHREFIELSGGTNTYRLYFQPVGTAISTNDDLVEVDYAGAPVFTWQVDVPTNGNPGFENSTCATLGYYNNPDVSTDRGFTYLPSGTSFVYINGSNSPVLGPPLTLDEPNYYAVNAGGTVVLKGRLTQVVKTDGDFVAGTAEGTAQFLVTEVVVGDRDYIADGDVIHNVYPTTATSDILEIDGDPTLACLAGTNALDNAGTRYVWGSFNFYGQAANLTAYGATGASKAFWADESGYGTISTGVADAMDEPKYVAFHAGKLALGFSGGSVLLSVVGEPFNYNGVDGAIEIATGDEITGLLEMPGDTLAVFGRSSIRKITGFTDADTVLGTISGNSGCFNYTAVLMGQDAVFAGVNGISTLQQTDAYGDFAGQRVSDPISIWLRPRLLRDSVRIESGGAVLAYPVRTKNQYRLVLANGDFVIATFSANKVTLMTGNHSQTGQLRIPYTISSEIAQGGRERIHTRWQAEGFEDLAIELDSGWGFDGLSFVHYFETSHMFSDASKNFITINKARMYGQGYGLASLNLKTSGVEWDFDQPYHNRVQDISMPRRLERFYNAMQPVTSIIDSSNWGLGIKMKIQNSIGEGSNLTEPSHICQVLVLQVNAEGAQDA